MTARAMGLVLRSLDGVTFHFDPGALCLELLPTGGPGELGRRYEVLHQPTDLAAWAARSRVRPLPETEVTELELAAAKQLRAALWGLAADRAHGRDPRPDDVAALNAAAAEPPLTPLLDGAHGKRWARPTTGTQLLSTVARDAIELFSGAYADRIRECSAGDCYLLFVDTSRPGRRRWCSMERCGNRHKVRALRARQDQQDQQDQRE